MKDSLFPMEDEDNYYSQTFSMSDETSDLTLLVENKLIFVHRSILGKSHQTSFSHFSDRKK